MKGLFGMKNPLVLIVVGWVLCGIIAAGGTNANFRAEFQDLYESPHHAREGLGFSLLWGIVGGPISLVVSFAMTGGYAGGWTLDGTPFPCTWDPEIWCK